MIEQEVASNPLLTLDPGIAIWSLVVFGLLFLLLKRFVWKPLLEGIDAREQRLKEAVEQAEQARIAGERTQQLRQKVLDDAKQHAGDLVAQARITAETLARKIEQEAQNERQSILRATQQSIESMRQAAQHHIRQQAVEMTLTLTDQLLRQKTGEREKQQTAERMLSELEGDSL